MMKVVAISRATFKPDFYLPPPDPAIILARRLRLPVNVAGVIAELADIGQRRGVSV